jgi:hypothetical protein
MRALLAILLLALSGGAALSEQFVPTIDASIEGGRRPVLRATTNLPDGTKILVVVDGPNYQGEAFAEVKDGSFVVGPFSNVEIGLIAGNYLFQIGSAAPELQPVIVRAVFGQHGENLAGPLVVREPTPIFGSAVVVLVKVDYRAW